jgi:hypothetical protein
MNQETWDKRHTMENYKKNFNEFVVKHFVLVQMYKKYDGKYYKKVHI